MRCSTSPTASSSRTGRRRLRSAPPTTAGHLVCNFDDAVAERVSASDVVQAAAAQVAGGGGGRATMARAGGTDAAKLGEALAEAERLIVAALS